MCGFVLLSWGMLVLLKHIEDQVLGSELQGSREIQALSERLEDSLASYRPNLHTNSFCPLSLCINIPPFLSFRILHGIHDNNCVSLFSSQANDIPEESAACFRWLELQMCEFCFHCVCKTIKQMKGSHYRDERSQNGVRLHMTNGLVYWFFMKLWLAM